MSKTTTEHKALRREGLKACRDYRFLLKRALNLSDAAASDGRPSCAHFWRVMAADWGRRLFNEQRLLAALRRGGPPAWRRLVMELPVAEVDALLEEAGARLPKYPRSHL